MIYQKNDCFLVSQSEDQEKSQILNQQLVELLQESRKNCEIYIFGLMEIALTPISHSILQQYPGKIKEIYSTEDIFMLIDKRISKMIRNKKIKKNWNVEDIIILLWLVSKYIESNKLNSSQSLANEDWKFISNLIPGSTPKGCMFKFISLKKVKLSLISWSKQEEQLLLPLVKKYGFNNWKLISEILYQQNKSQKVFRTPKQCREHWNCYLDPKLKKGPWSQQQDVKLLQNVRQNKGERKWSSIKHIFEGRTQNALKNRYNLLIERQKKFTPQKSQRQLVREYLKGKSAKLSISLKGHNQQKQNSIQKQQIFEQQQIIQALPSHRLIKSQNSSFKLSQNYKKTLSESTIPSPIKSSSLNNILLMNMNSIYSNQQGFYIYKPFYQ